MKKFAATLSMLLIVAASAAAEIKSIDITVFGMD